jgi:regulator of protease activity HflC (stomatin/prohibitin superfamily)
MFGFIFACILFLIGVGLIVTNKRWTYVETETDRYTGKERTNTTSYRWIALTAGGVLTAIAVGWIASSTIVSVSTKKIGVVTAFGKPTGELGNGLHIKAPWEKVTEIDAAIQTDNYLNGPQDPGENDTIPVRIANQSVAGIEVSIRWRIKPEAATRLYQDYKQFDHVRDSLVTRNLRSALNQNFASYNPLQILQTGQIPQDILAGIGFTVATDLSKIIGEQIDVQSVIIPLVNFDDSTQGKINAFQAAQADTRIAAQNVLTADQNAKAANAVRQALKDNPGYLTSKCLDIIAKGVQLPAGFNCPGTTGSAVVVPSK